MHKFSLLVVVAFLSSTFTFAQTTLTLPQASPRATVTQTIGVTEVTVNYGAPGVKNRKVWGNLVPYNQVWRAGANEATTISFSRDVRISQENIPAGTYTLYVLPQDSVNWQLILSKQKGLWGTEGYDSKQDQVRIPMAAQTNDFHETLQYSFNDVQLTSGRLYLRWADKQLPITIRMDTHAQALELIKETMATAKPFDWAVYAQATNYLISQNQDHELALEWINKSLSIEENFYNTWLKAKLLAQKNEYQQALELNKKAQKLGKKDQQTYQAYAKEIENAAILWKEQRYLN
ncbi:DUF2911 domain-containing protein [Rufibacter sp. LB8]|uniref:DUF2911 domain-containing protein n=1 Tax=Rufibacter sp. LB8 TaxID=2777781 RepID=UPI00178C6E4A|nr:DUF2911 domain-containing protein [Rufibacter sp. LB8]